MSSRLADTLVGSENESGDSLLYGPLGEDAYTKAGAARISSALENGKINKENREVLWKNFKRFESILESRIGSRTGLNINQVMKEAMWQLRQEIGTNSPNESWEQHVQAEIFNFESRDISKFNLDTHHLEVYDYAPRLINSLFTAAHDHGISDESPFLRQIHSQLDLIPAVMDIHDIFKFLLPFKNNSGQDEPDHRTFIKYFIKKYFVNQQVEVNGEMVTLDESRVDLMGELALKHENLYEEEEWSSERKNNMEVGFGMGVEFVIDTMTNGVVVEKQANGEWLATFDFSQMDRFFNLAERHIRVFTDGEKAVNAQHVVFEKAKAFEPGWILGTVNDFVGILKGWEQLGVKADADAVEKFIQRCLKVFYDAIEAINDQITRSPKLEEKKALQLAHIQLAIDGLEQISSRRVDEISAHETQNIKDEVFLDKVEEIITDRAAMVQLSNAGGRAYAERSGKDPEDFTLDKDEAEYIINGQDLLSVDMNEAARLHIELGRNVVGLLSLVRIIGLVQSGILKLDTLANKSVEDILEIIASDVDADTPQIKAIKEEAARSSHAGWVASQFLLGREHRIELFDARQNVEKTSDWIQVRSAARYILEHRTISKMNLEDLLYNITNKGFVLGAAEFCHQEYCLSQLEVRKSKQYSVHPEWMESAELFTEEQEDIIINHTRPSEYGDPRLQRRFLYAMNALGMAALQEGLASLAQRRNPTVKPSDMLKLMIDGKLNEEELFYLGTLEKTLYLELTVMKNVFEGKREQTRSMFPDVNNQVNVQQFADDYQQLRVAAELLYKHFLPNYYKDKEVPEIDIVNTHGRPTEIITFGQEQAEIKEKLSKIGILAHGKIDQVVMYSGGAVQMDATRTEQFVSQEKKKVLDEIRSGKRVLVVTGGTNSGFMEIVGVMCQEIRDTLKEEGIDPTNKFQVLGVTPAYLLTFDASKHDPNNWESPYLPAAGHTHHLLVEKKEYDAQGNAYSTGKSKFGDELNTIMAAIQAVRDTFSDDGVRVEAVIGNGGGGTADEVKGLMDLQAEIRVLKDSHRMASLLYTAANSDTLAAYEEQLKTEMEAAEKLATDEPTPENINTQKQKKKNFDERANIFRLLDTKTKNVDIKLILNNGVPIRVIAQNETNFQLAKQRIKETVSEFK
jgi:hypothetical protein